VYVHDRGQIFVDRKAEGEEESVSLLFSYSPLFLAMKADPHLHSVQLLDF
jgi:hypothetical protein